MSIIKVPYIKYIYTYYILYFYDINELFLIIIRILMAVFNCFQIILYNILIT